MIKRRFEIEILLDQDQSVPQGLPVTGERNEEESGVDADKDAGVIEMFDPDVDQIGRRQVGAVRAESVGFQSDDATNERDAMKSNCRQDHETSGQ